MSKFINYSSYILIIHLVNLTSITIGQLIYFCLSVSNGTYVWVNPFEKAEIEQYADIVIDLLYARFEE